MIYQFIYCQVRMKCTGVTGTVYGMINVARIQPIQLQVQLFQTKQNETKQNKTKLNETKQNKTKHNKTK